LRQHTSEDLPRQEHGEDGERSEYRDHDREWRRLIPTECRQVHPAVWNRQGDQAHVAKGGHNQQEPGRGESQRPCVVHPVPSSTDPRSIFHLIGLYDRLVGDLPPEGPVREDLVDLDRVLYGLDAILRLHVAQEEELYVSLGDEAGETGVAAGAAA